LLSTTLSIILTGLFFSSMFLLISNSLTLIVYVLKILNLAQGALFALGAYITITVIGWMSTLNLPLELWYLGFIITAFIMMLIGICLEKGLISRAYGETMEIFVLLTNGIGLALYDAIKGIWGVFPLMIPYLYHSAGNLSFYEISFPTYNLFVIIIGYVLSLALWLWLFRTHSGRVIRASAIDSEMSRALGINVRRIYTLIFALAVALCGLAGAIIIPIRSAVPGFGAEEAIISLAIIAAGGLGSFKGAFIVSHVMGISRAFGISFYPEIELAIIFLIVAIILAIKPTGLFGKEERRL